MRNESDREANAPTDVTDTFAPPHANVEPQIDASLAGPWRRWLARNLDLGWQMGSITLGLGVILGMTSNPLLAEIDAPGISQLVGIGAMLVAFVLDAAVHGLFGNTPAKALLGVRVLSREGERLTFSGHLGRNLHAWFSGFGLGIPLVALITMARQHGRVKAGKSASYDENAAHRVIGTRIGAARVLFAILLYLGVTTGLVALATGALNLGSFVNSRGDEPARTWRNSDTGIDTAIEGFWTATRTTDPTGLEYTTFSEPLDQAAIIFARETIEGLEIDGYVAAFREATATNMKFDNAGSFVERNARPAWVCRAALVQPLGLRAEVMIVQYDSGFWRTVKVQGTPTSATDAIADRLCAALWTTVE